MIENIIKKAIEGGLHDNPKGDTINIWSEFMENPGTRVRKSNLKENAISAKAILKSISVLQSKPSSAQGIIGMLRSMVAFLLIKKPKKISEHLNLNGLANKLGITKEGVTRLIWLLEDARNTSNGSELYSSETISLVKNALLKECILKQTTFLLDLQPSLMKKESKLMSKQWRVNDYGTRVMVAPSVVNVIGI